GGSVPKRERTAGEGPLYAKKFQPRRLPLNLSCPVPSTVGVLRFVRPPRKAWGAHSAQDDRSVLVSLPIPAHEAVLIEQAHRAVLPGAYPGHLPPGARLYHRMVASHRGEAQLQQVKEDRPLVPTPVVTQEARLHH